MLENKILHDNARQALFAEVMPVIKEVFTKYNGIYPSDHLPVRVELSFSNI